MYVGVPSVNILVGRDKPAARVQQNADIYVINTWQQSEQYGAQGLC